MKAAIAGQAIRGTKDGEVMRITRRIWVVMFVTMLLAFVACNGPLSLPNNPENTPASTQEVRISDMDLETITLKDKILTWEIVLKSVVWSGAEVSVNLNVTNKGNQPADFPYDNVGGPRSVNFIAIDSYGISYTPEENPTFNVESIYPGETRTFKTEFTLNSRPGKTALYVTRYTGVQKVILFDIGAPK